MNRRRYISIALWLLLFSFPCIAGTNLIQNGDFEQWNDVQGFPHWVGQNGNTMDPSQCRPERTHPGEGKQSVRIGPDIKEYWLCQNVKLKPHTRYVLSGFVKGKDIVPGATSGAGANIWMWKGKDWKSRRGFGPFIGTFDWRNRSMYGKEYVVFDTDDETDWTITLVHYRADGTSWFDDVRLEKASESEPLVGRAPMGAVTYPADWQNGVLHMQADTPTALTFCYLGEKTKVNQASLVLDLPFGIAIRDSFPTLKPIKNEIATREVNVDGKTRFHHEIKIPSNNISRMTNDDIRFTWRVEDMVYLQADSALAGKTESLRWQLKVNGKCGEWHIITLPILPPPEPVRLPEHFELFLGNSLGLLTTDETLRNDLLNQFLSTGIRHEYLFGTSTAFEVSSPSWRKYFFFGWTQNGPGSGLASQWAEELAGEKGAGLWEISIRNQSLPGVFCPEYIAQGGKEFTSRLKRYFETYKATNPVWLIFDYEPDSCWHSCYCSQCMKAFRALAGLRDDEVLNPEIIEQKYAKEWISFRTKQRTQTVRHIVEIFREVFPDSCKFLLCTDHLRKEKNIHEENIHKRGIDIRIMDDFVDVHNPMIYYTGPAFYDDLQINVEGLKKPVWPFMATSEKFFFTFSQYSPKKIEQCLLISAAMGCEKVGFWHGAYGMDGLTMQHIQKAMKQIACLEEYWYKGKLIQQPGIVQPVASGRKVVRYQIHRLGDTLLLSIFNLDPIHAAKVQIFPPDIDGMTPISLSMAATEKTINSPSTRPDNKNDISKTKTLDIEPNGNVFIVVSYK